MYSGERGAPENKGELLEAIRRVVRTNPVTGWKSIYVVGQHVSHINGLSEDESNNFLDWFLQLVIIMTCKFEAGGRTSTTSRFGIIVAPTTLLLRTTCTGILVQDKGPGL
ncbi:uncharacterized protein BKA55DRAFT_84873 [Fusarium redolens]|uniref:Uncharacterized protein n=1 Tax=Fusarium redolens TaxID=48865 RepID=A0A9P9GRN9_FUSRE|nr:uncharacterized protein BKA55DRAFT_84873 [Fusarium redolens]KAH7244428.1 hypothetical protein BKA55DRAFT_84873 [Fusarium redolens]